MHSASPSGGLEFRDLPGAAWQRTRAAVPGSSLWSALLVFLLVFVVAKSTVTAGWVPGVDVAPAVALAGAAFIGVLAVTPLPWWTCITTGLALAPLVAAYESAPAFKAIHGGDPSGLALIQVWLARIGDGNAIGDTAFALFLVCCLMWVTGAWLSWCVLRWRQPLIGLVPGAAAFATNVLNSLDQNAFVFYFTVLTLALLLWTNYTGSIASAALARVKLTSDARWDFWESGLLAMAGLVLIALVLPPLSTVDRTGTMESSLFTDWAQLQTQWNHVGPAGTGPGGGPATTGFSTEVSLGGPLKKSGAVVFVYTITGSYPGPRYFRGVNDTVQENGKWVFSGSPSPVFNEVIGNGEPPPYSEQYQKMALATFNINVRFPPGGNNGDVLFYPGQLHRVNRVTLASEVWVPPVDAFTSKLATIDRLASESPPTSAGGYDITVEYPNATESDLRSAGTDYAQWLNPYESLPGDFYRSQDVTNRIAALARRITAGKTNPYDQATAIEAYLRSGVFHYDLNPIIPYHVDSLDYFLFTGHHGYCQYFAMAMADMLRSLGIPTRLVNGYGPGLFDTATEEYIVRGEDAHTWVESYFPGYGWIPFEPTNDNTYFPIARGTESSNLCLSDDHCDNPVSPPGSVQLPAVHTPKSPANVGGQDSPTGPTGFQFRAPDASTLTTIAGVLLAVLLMLAAFAARYLRPRTVMGVWKRMLVLARLAGAEIEPGETPLELTRRLARVFPEAAASLRDLASSFVVAAYAPPDLARSTRGSVMEAWAALRPMMMRRVARRFRPGRA
jgi:hypothetical protein